MSNLELIKAIRTETSLPLGSIQKAIDAVGTDKEAIIKYLREQGVLKAQSRQDRVTKNGGVFTYCHEYRIGVLLEIKCETDFVARSDSFKTLGNDICLHIAAYQPAFLSADFVDPEFIKKELEIAKTQLINEGKPEAMLANILKGKEAKIVEESCLLSQSFLKNPDLKVSDQVALVSQETGEKIEVTRFTIMSL